MDSATQTVPTVAKSKKKGKTGGLREIEKERNLKDKLDFRVVTVTWEAFRVVTETWEEGEKKMSHLDSDKMSLD